MAACSEQQPTSVWGASGAGAAGSFASILAQNVTTAPEQAQVYIPVQQQDSRADAQIKLQEDYRKWQNMMEQVEQTSDSRLAVKPRLKRRKDRDSFEDMEAEPIVLDAETLKKYFHMPLNVAAQKIGVCTTALKQACRKIGIKSWPHRMLKNMAVTMGASPAVLGLERSVASPSDASSCLEQQDTVSSIEDTISGFELGGDSLDGWADLFSQPADQSYHAVLADCNAEPASSGIMEGEEQQHHATAVPCMEVEPTDSRSIHPYVNPKDFSSSKEGGACKTEADAATRSPHPQSKPVPAHTSSSLASAKALHGAAPFHEWLLAVQSGYGGPPPAVHAPSSTSEFASFARTSSSVPSSPRTERAHVAAPDVHSASSSSARGAVAPSRMGDASSLRARAGAGPKWGRAREREEEEEKREERRRRRSECERLRKQVRELVAAHADMLQQLLSTQDGLSRELEERAELEQHIAMLEQQARQQQQQQQQRAIAQRV